MNTFKNFKEVSEHFNEQGFSSLSALYLKLDTIRDKNRIQQKILNFFTDEERRNE